MLMHKPTGRVQQRKVEMLRSYLSLVGNRSEKNFLIIYHRFRWYATLENKTLAETFPKFPSIIRVIDMSDRNPPITATSLIFHVMLAGCDWWISIRHVDNTYDWRKFWKRFRECFVFQSRVSTKTVVIEKSSICRRGISVFLNWLS